jgi:hypothetical protein
MYSIYHIPTFVHKDGSIGKIGCTGQTPWKKRVEQQTDDWYELLETHKDVYVASKREIKLQKEYGYKVDTTPYFNSIKRNPGKQHLGGSASLKSQWKNDRDRMIQQCKKSGKMVVELGLGCHALTSEEHSKNGSKGFANGLGKLSQEEKNKIFKKRLEGVLKNRKFTKEEVQWIRKVFKPYDKKYGVVGLAKKFNHSIPAMRNLIKGRSYKDY